MPSKKAVALRKNKSKSITVILSNVNDSLYSQILSDIIIGATKSVYGHLLVAIESNKKAEPVGLGMTKTFGNSVKWAWKNEYAKKVN